MLQLKILKVVDFQKRLQQNSIQYDTMWNRGGVVFEKLCWNIKNKFKILHGWTCCVGRGSENRRYPFHITGLFLYPVV